MSIAAISSSFVAAVRERAPVAPVASVDGGAAPRVGAQAQRDGGRRHELVGAMNQVLGIEGEQDKSDAQAVFRFAHALMSDLRSLAGGARPDGPGRGHAWGRRDWSDLPQRIDALATAAGASVMPPPAEPTEPVTPNVAVASAPEPEPTTAELPLPEVPPQPNPVTTTSAALHLMQVPSSHLLEAYAALRQALGDESDAPGDTRAELAAFLDRLSQSLLPDTPPALPAGSVLNVSA